MPRPFSDDDLDAAAGFLAERHARHRAAEPLLPAEADFRAEVEAVWRRPGASGAVSEHGFLIGAPREHPIWGPNIWVELAGHAVEEAEAARDLYALAAQRWVDDGLTRQYVHVPAHDRELVDAWFRLSFGQQHAAGIREVPEHVDRPEGVREATEDDLETLIALDPLLPDHQARSPVFGRGPQETEEELREELLEGLASPHSVDLLAEVDGRVVGGFYVTTIEDSSMHAGLGRPPGAAFLAWAATRPEVRGGGVGLRLTQAAFAWARARGHDVIVTDWRVTNLLSSRFWPARGFRTTFLRLYRSIP
jgi:GNAT superfamily N-acetyltransferase